MSDILEAYSKELVDHLSIDEFNLKDVQLQLPGRRHIWVGRLMRHKHEVNILRKKKKDKLQKKYKNKVMLGFHHQLPKRLLQIPIL